MELIQTVILGIVQGLTEFLPISSSGHLVILPWLFKWKDLGQTFDVALHMGTLLALVFYFWKDWIEIIKNWRKPFLWLILIGCIPAALVGYKFENYFETVFRSPFIVGIFIICMAILLLVSERYSKKQKEMDSINLGDVIFIGLAQALALMPGVSRSGITMTAGLFSGLKREAAARFSFILAMPITLGAGLLKLKHLITSGLPGKELSLFVIGIIFAVISGYFAIKYLLKFLQSHTFYLFVLYRLVFGAIIMLVYFLR